MYTETNNQITTAMKKLTVTSDRFLEMLSGLIASGVTFEAKEVSSTNDLIEIIFTGGF